MPIIVGFGHRRIIATSNLARVAGGAMRLIASLTILLTSLSVQADILHLRDGSRHCGTLIKQTNSEIVFRIILADGASAVRRFQLSRVLRLERGGATDAILSDTDGQGPRREVTREDLAQMLREACELVDDGDLPAALRALQRMVAGASDEVLKDLDRRARAARGRALAEFMAAVRIRSALEGGQGQLFDLRRATRYEARALGVQLAQLQARLLGTRFYGRTLETWAGRRDEYTELRPDARWLVTRGWRRPQSAPGCVLTRN